MKVVRYWGTFSINAGAYIKVAWTPYTYDGMVSFGILSFGTGNYVVMSAGIECFGFTGDDSSPKDPDYVSIFVYNTSQNNLSNATLFVDVGYAPTELVSSSRGYTETGVTP